MIKYLIFIFFSRFDAMDMGGFIYADQFLQMSARLPSKHIYGLGEHQGQFLLSTNWNRMTLFNLDQMPVENVRKSFLNLLKNLKNFVLIKNMV